MESLTVYTYHPETAAFMGTEEAWPSPLEPEDYLIPAHATRTAPPETDADEVAIWTGEAWEIRQDWRGREYWLADGSHHTIDTIDEGKPQGALDAPPPAPVSPEQIRGEARRRILAIADKDKQDNMLAWGLETLRDYGTDVTTWPKERKAMNQEFSDKWRAIKAIRTRSNEIEALSPLPADFDDDRHWPKAGFDGPQAA